MCFQGLFQWKFPENLNIYFTEYGFISMSQIFLDLHFVKMEIHKYDETLVSMSSCLFLNAKFLKGVASHDQDLWAGCILKWLLIWKFPENIFQKNMVSLQCLCLLNFAVFENNILQVYEPYQTRKMPSQKKYIHKPLNNDFFIWVGINMMH